VELTRSARFELVDSDRLAHCEAVQATAGVEADYLNVFFRKIDDKFGPLDIYRRTKLGVSDSQLAMLKARLLE